MKSSPSLPSLHTALLAVSLSLLAANPASAATDGFEPLFNGKDLTGWDGSPKFWSVRDGAITGQTTKENPTTGNTFLVWKGGNVDNFKLRFRYRIVGGNSGVQYRSKVLNPATWSVGGYQADFEAGTKFSGILYDESGVAGGRGIMAERGEKVTWTADCKKQVTGATGKSDEIQAKIKNEDWNDYAIVADGDHLTHRINGVLTVDVTDECAAKALKSGVLALQVHAGPPMLVQFKDLQLKKLGASSGGVSDIELVQGSWKASKLVANGDDIPADALTDVVLVIKDNGYSVQTGQGPDEGTFKLNSSKNPRHMDVQSGNAGDIPAIYEVDGDTFKVCYAMNGAARPTSFSSSAGSDHVLAIYKRKK